MTEGIETTVLAVEAVSKRNNGLEMVFLHQIVTDGTCSLERRASTVAFILIAFVV